MYDLGADAASPARRVAEYRHPAERCGVWFPCFIPTRLHNHNQRVFPNQKNFEVLLRELYKECCVVPLMSLEYDDARVAN